MEIVQQHGYVHTLPQNAEGATPMSECSSGIDECKKRSFDRMSETLSEVAKQIKGPALSCFEESLLWKAVAAMLYPGQSGRLIALAAAYMWIKSGELPASSCDLYSQLIDFDFKEDKIILSFEELLKTDSGATNLRSVLSQMNVEGPQKQPEKHCQHQNHSNQQQEEPPVHQQNQQQQQQQKQQQHHHHHQQDQQYQQLQLDQQNHQQRQHQQLPQQQQEQLQYQQQQGHRDSDVVDAPISATGRSSTISSATGRDTELTRLRLHRHLVEKENQFLRERFLCKICKSRQIAVTFLPCGHFVSCEVCSEPCRNCPCCGKQVLAEKRTFLC